MLAKIIPVVALLGSHDIAEQKGGGNRGCQRGLRSYKAQGNSSHGLQGCLAFPRPPFFLGIDDCHYDKNDDAEEQRAGRHEESCADRPIDRGEPDGGCHEREDISGQEQDGDNRYKNTVALGARNGAIDGARYQ